MTLDHMRLPGNRQAGGEMDEHEARLRKLRMRSWRRGIKEMDLILGPFSDSQIEAMSPADLDLYEVLLNENDQDLYPWITARFSGNHPGPAQFGPLLDRVADFARDRLAKKN